MPGPGPDLPGNSGRPGRNDPRRAAFLLLSRLDREPFDLAAELDRTLDTPGWDPRDRRLAAELAWGVARWRFRLDHAIRARTGRPLKDLDRNVRTCLRLGAYQLLFMDAIPPNAAVNETVKLAGNPRRRGFVNGVLRGLAREGEPALPAQGPERLAAEWSLPPWLAQRWWRDEGPQRAEARARQAASAPTLTVRLAADREVDRFVRECMDMGAEALPLPYLPAAVGISGPVRVTDLPGYAGGAFVVQDPSSQLAGRLVAALPGERVLDACAAPGGKCQQLSEMVGPTGQVVAVERDPGRAERLHRNLERMRADNVQVVIADAGVVSMPQLNGPFDRILLDAPCSGLGTLSRNPEGKWWKSEAGIRSCGVAQRDLLSHLAPMVKPGGVLVYAVCTGEPEETAAQVTAFLANHPEFSVRPAGELLGPEAAPWISPEGYLDTSRALPEGGDPPPRAGDGDAEPPRPTPRLSPRVAPAAFFGVHLVRRS
ncbi:MAG: 16S rRNA (cytosine(967)-C(5))-methyltransferase RsmB [Nitrospirota bacterium]|nr:16S rRNA (cytosine(967)-C(5))-methyltransferase RsmB [Nitrospirota bacterium]